MSASVTIKDVAKLSQTSVGTVSRYLNDGKCHKDRAQRIKAAIQHLNYVPNIHARAVRASNSNCIGIIISQITMQSSFWMQSLLTALTQEISMSKYRVYIQVVDTADNSRRLHNLLLPGSMDGLILIGRFEKAYFELMEEKLQIPAITYWEPMPYSRGLSLQVDLSSAMQQLTEHLISLGHTTIGMIAANGSVNQEKINMFLQAVRRYIPDYDASLIETLNANKDFPRESAEATARLLERHPAISALFYCSDTLALGGLGELSQRKLLVPQDISVVSFDNSFVSVGVFPELTCIGFDYSSFAAQMVDELVRMIENGDDAATARRTGKIIFQFFRRGSTGLAAGRDRKPKITKCGQVAKQKLINKTTEGVA